MAKRKKKKSQKIDQNKEIGLVFWNYAEVKTTGIVYMTFSYQMEKLKGANKDIERPVPGWKRLVPSYKKNLEGGVQIYGTVHTLLERVYNLILKISQLYNDRIRSPDFSELKEQEYQNDFISISIQLRLLLETLSVKKFEEKKIKLYQSKNDNSGKLVSPDSIHLINLLNIIKHHRYIVFNEEDIGPIFSDHKTLDKNDIFSKRFKVIEFLQVTSDILSEVNFSDLTHGLRSRLEEMNKENLYSNLFIVLQNLMLLSTSIVENIKIIDGSKGHYQNLIFNLFDDLRENTLQNAKPMGEKLGWLMMTFRNNLRFNMSHDIDAKEIISEIFANGENRKSELYYKDFFEIFDKYYGDVKLFQKKGITFVLEEKKPETLAFYYGICPR